MSPNPRSWSPSLILALSDRPDLFIFFNRVDRLRFFSTNFLLSDHSGDQNPSIIIHFQDFSVKETILLKFLLPLK